MELKGGEGETDGEGGWGKLKQNKQKQRQSVPAHTGKSREAAVPSAPWRDSETV